MKIVEKIKQALKKAGVSEKYAERIQKFFKIEKDENIENYVELFKNEMLPTIAEAEQAAIAAATQKAVEEYEKKHNLKDGKAIETKKDDEPDLSGLSPEVKAIIESQKTQISELTTLVKGVVKNQLETQKTASVREKLQGKVDAKYIDKIIGKINLDAEDLDAEIEAKINEHNEFVQMVIADAVGSDYVPPSGGNPTEKTVEEWAKIMEADVAQSGTVDLGLASNS